LWRKLWSANLWLWEIILSPFIITEAKMKTKRLWMTTSIILFILLLISVFTGGFKTYLLADETQQEAVPKPPIEQINLQDLIDDDTVKGDPNAPVTIVEWSDFECPFCERFYQQTLGLIEKEYIDTGKVNMVYRDFPLSFHENAQKAAEAAECAGEQGKFWEMHDSLFENGVEGGVRSFKKFAKDLDLNDAEFNECLDSGKMESEVKKDMVDGQNAGVKGTPAFIINGKLLSGAQPFSVFKQAIDEALTE